MTMDELATLNVGGAENVAQARSVLLSATYWLAADGAQRHREVASVLKRRVRHAADAVARGHRGEAPTTTVSASPLPRLLRSAMFSHIASLQPAGP
jgi:hypothetical protein